MVGAEPSGALTTSFMSLLTEFQTCPSFLRFLSSLSVSNNPLLRLPPPLLTPPPPHYLLILICEFSVLFIDLQMVTNLLGTSLSQLCDHPLIRPSCSSAPPVALSQGAPHFQYHTDGPSGLSAYVNIIKIPLSLNWVDSLMRIHLMSLEWSTVGKFNLPGGRGKGLKSAIPVAGRPPPLPKCVQGACSPSFFLPSVTSWDGFKPTGEAEATPQEFGTPAPPLGPVASAHSCLPLPVV